MECTTLDKALIDIRTDDLRASEVIRRMRALPHKRLREMQALDVNEVAKEIGIRHI
jgi:hypothetical protein